jgi:protein-S-isoprenylcysteine O-methyltransferase Ste14
MGTTLLVAATLGIILSSRKLISMYTVRIGIFGGIAAIFFYLLIYTLFFALPFQDTYIKEKSHTVCKNGVYALCRHPGVLWFTLFYAFLGLAVMIPTLFVAGSLFSILNILYVLFQDRWTFMKSFENYEGYKVDTPFLVPNKKSIKHCLRTLSRKEGTV